MKQIKTEFKIYRKEDIKLNASIFDFIDGSYETKQTKGLAYIIKIYPSFLKDLLKIIPGVEYESFDQLIVDAELRTGEKRRSDILLRIYKNKTPVIALLFEAKSIKSKVINIQSIENQAKVYLKDHILDEFIGKTHGIILTKNELISDEFKCITWNKLITVLNNYYNKDKKRKLVKEFTDFLIKVNNTMEYYEKEVASIPAQKSIKCVEKFSIYHRFTDSDSIKDSIFVTFRKEKGKMEKLYKVKKKLTLSRKIVDEIKKNKFEEGISIDNLDNADLMNLKKFIVECINEEIKVDYNFYILDNDHSIDLKHKPRPKRNNLGYWYFSLSELLSGKEIVEVESKNI